MLGSGKDPTVQIERWVHDCMTGWKEAGFKTPASFFPKLYSAFNEHLAIYLIP